MNNLDLLIPQATAETDTWTWATVEGVMPLRVRLDGDTSALDVTPDCLYADPSVGQRVWVQRTGRRVIVHLPINGTPIPDGPGGSIAVEFSFPSATKTWACQHNLNASGVTVTTYDLNGEEFIGDVDYIDNNTVVISWFFPSSGYVRISK